MTDFENLLATLARHEVAFIVVGGAAAFAHGSARLTQDLDIVYQRSPANLGRLVSALSDVKPYLRGAPSGLPFVWNRTTLANGLNFTLVTSLGDILGEIPGGGTYEDLVADAIELHVFGIHCLCLSLTQLIRAKRAAGRVKDLEALSELEAIQEVPVRGPTGRASALAHDADPMSVGQSEFLVGIFLNGRVDLAQFVGVERTNGECRQSMNKREKLYGPVLIVPAQEPAVPFGQHQRRRDQGRWLGE